MPVNEEIEKELKGVLEQVQQTEKEIGAAQGAIATNMKRLNDELGLSSLDAAKERQVELEKQIKDKKEEIQKDYAELKEKFQW